MAVLQTLIGGVKLVYSLPGYTILGLSAVATVGWTRRQTVSKPIVWCLATAALLGGYVVWRAWNSPVDYLARSDFYLILGAMLVYLITAIHIVNPRHRLALIWALFGLLIVHVGIGVVQFKEQHNFMLLPWVFRPDYGYRASGFYICPNHLAGLLEMTGLIALSLAIWGRGKTWARILASYAALMALVGVALTGSRGGYLSTIAGLATFVVITLVILRKVKKRWFWGAFLLAFVGLVGVVGSSIWAMRKSPDLERRLGQVYEPTNMRFLMWKAALDAHELSPWVGVGSGTYLFYGRHFRSHFVQADPQHVHNDYLELLAEYGIIGCVFMGIFLATHAASGFAGIAGVIRTRLKPFGLARSNEMALLVGTLSGLAALTVHSVVDFNFHIPANTVLLAFLLGILANPRTPPPEDAPRWRINGLPLRLAPPLLGVIVIAVAVPKILPEYYGERARMALRDRAAADAISYAGRAMKMDPKNPNVYYYFGEAKHSLAMAEKDSVARYQLHGEAAMAFAEGLKHFPADLNLLLKLGRTLDNMKRFREAEVMFRLALQADPNLATVYAYYGYHYYLQRRLTRAEKLYLKAAQLGDTEIAPAGLNDIHVYRIHASDEDLAADYPIEDEAGDELWQPGEP